MSLTEIFILAVALAIDAMIVSFSYGLVLSTKRLKSSLLLSFSFALFQFLMPIIGWYATSLVYIELSKYSKWIVFAIFIYLAIKFIKSALSKEENKIECISFFCLIGLSIATSIDALGAGISIRLVDDEIYMPSIIIGIVTFVCSYFGFWIAHLLKKLPSKYIEFAGSTLFLYLAISAIL